MKAQFPSHTPDRGFVRIGSRWHKTRHVSRHRAAGRTVDTRVRPLDAELQVTTTGLYGEARFRLNDPCETADSLLHD